MVAFRTHFYESHVLHQDARTVNIGFDHDLFKVFNRFQKAHRVDNGIQLVTILRREVTHLTGRHLNVLFLNGTDNLVRGQVVLVQLFRIEPNTHRVRATEHFDFANAVDTRKRFLDIVNQIVTQVGFVQLTVLIDKAHHHQEVSRGLFNAHTQLLNDLRKARFDLLQLVLDLNLSNIRIGTGFKSDVDRNTTRTIGVGRHIQIAVQTRHGLFNLLRNRIFDRFCRSARIRCRHSHLRRSDLRVLGHRQTRDRQNARQHDHNGDHPSKNRTPNKKSRHICLPLA